MTADEREQHGAESAHECTLLGLLSGEQTGGGLRCMHGYTIAAPGGEIRDGSGRTYVLGEPEEIR